MDVQETSQHTTIKSKVVSLKDSHLVVADRPQLFRIPVFRIHVFLCLPAVTHLVLRGATGTYR